MKINCNSFSNALYEEVRKNISESLADLLPLNDMTMVIATKYHIEEALKPSVENAAVTSATNR